MGRLQRKKPAAKKKKKKVAAGDGSGPSDGAEKKIIALTDFSRDKKKSGGGRPKAAVPAKSAAPTDSKLNKVKQFLREVKIELKRVTWPSRTQTIGSTAVVIVLVMIISIFLGLVDVGLSNLVRSVLH